MAGEGELHPRERLTDAQRDILLELSELMGRPRTVTEVFGAFMERVVEAAAFDYVSLIVMEPDGRFATTVAAYPEALRLTNQGVRHHRGELELEMIQQYPEGFEFVPAKISHHAAEQLMTAKIARVWGCPLFDGPEIIGLITVGRLQRGPFDQASVTFLKAASRIVGTAVVQDRHIERLERTAARSAVISDLALLLNSEEGLEVIFDRILALLEQAVEFDYVGLMVLVGDEGELRQVGARPPIGRPIGSRSTFSETGLDALFEFDGVVQFRTDHVDGTATDQLRQAGIIRIADVILRHDGEPVGAFVLGRKENRRFADDECQFLLTLSHLLGQAIGKGRRVERIEQEAARSALVNELSFLLNAGEPVESLFDRLAKLIRRAIPCEYVGLATVGAESDGRMRTIDWNARDGENLHVGERTAGEVALASIEPRARQVFQFPLATGITPLIDEMHGAGLRRSMLGTLKDGDVPIGVLHLSRGADHPFTAAEMGFFEVVARIFAQAVANQLRISRVASEAEDERIIALVGAVAAGVADPRAVVAELFAPISMFVPSAVVAFGYVEGDSVRFLSRRGVTTVTVGGALQNALDEGQTVLGNVDEVLNGRLGELPRKAGLVRLVHTRVRSAGSLVGVLSVGTTDPEHEFSERDLRILRRITQVVGPAMAHAEVTQRRAAEAEEQRIVAEVGAIASREPDPEKLLKACEAPLGRLVPRLSLSYMFLDLASNSYCFSSMPTVRFEVGALGREAITTGQAWGGVERIAPTHPARAAGVQALALTANYATGAVAGLLGVSSMAAGHAFNERDLRVFQHATQIIGPAMEAARANREVARQGELYNLILSSLSEAVVVLNPSLQVVFENANGHRLTYALDPERKLRTVDEHLPALPTTMRSDFARAAIDHVPARGRVHFDLEGQAVWYDYELVPLKDPNLALLAVASDVTAEVLREEEQEQHRSQLAQASRLSALGELIGGVAHELNNPLTAILGFAEVMSVSAPGTDHSEEIGIIQKEALRARNIVRDLLFIARPGPVEQGHVALTEVVGHVERLRRTAWSQQRIAVSIDVDDGGAEVKGNENQLTQVLLNLVTNAEHAVADVADKWIEINVSRLAGNEVVVEVRDGGSGMDEETASRVFEPFFTTKQGQGTGLGLSLSYSIVASHRGRIEVESAPGRGSAFRVTLPLAETAATPEAPAVATGLSRSARVLVVDDEPSLRKVCQRMITSMGHDCATAENAATAVSLAGATEFDLVICDYRLAGETADDVVRELAALDPAILNRVVIATGATTDPGVVALTARYNLRLVAKPYGFEEITQMLGAVVFEEAS